MKLTFLGTRGEIDARTPLHGMHTSLEVAYRGKRVMIDAGADWLGELHRARPQAIVITHAHPDHAFGLKQGADCPVYATLDAWTAMARWPIAERYEVEPRVPFRVRGITFEAFPVEHSLNAPAVGYRIRAGRVAIFYAPDVIFIEDREQALRGAALYIGDGATLEQSFIRKRGDRLIGHAPVKTQLGWCEKEGVPRAIISHCGAQIVGAARAEVLRRLWDMAAPRGVEVELAYDGMEVVLR